MLRALGAIVLLLALAVLASDLRPLVTGEGGVRLSALGEWWFWLDKDSLQVLQPAIERHLTPAIWDPGVQTILEWPLAIELGVLGGMLWVLGRPRKEPPKGRDKLDFNRK